MSATTILPPLETLTLQNARAVFEQGVAAIKAGQAVFDLGSVRLADSSAVAVLLAWRRAARKAGVKLAYVNLPAGLDSLATLYGVDTLLIDTPANPQHH